MGIRGDINSGIDFNRLPKDPLPYVPGNPRPQRVNVEPWEHAEPHAPAYLANSHAMDYLLRAITGVASDVTDFGGAGFSPKAAQLARANLEASFGAAGDASPGRQKLIQSLRAAEGKSVVVLRDTPEVSEESLRRGANEEYDHVLQAALNGGVSTAGHVDARDFMMHPLARKAARGLLRAKYPSDPETLAAGIGVRLMRPGLAETDLGLHDRTGEASGFERALSSGLP